MDRLTQLIAEEVDLLREVVVAEDIIEEVVGVVVVVVAAVAWVLLDLSALLFCLLGSWHSSLQQSSLRSLPWSSTTPVSSLGTLP